MKILMIAPTPFFADRGCHVRIYEEARHLQQLGHEILVCTYPIGREMPGIKTIRTINPLGYRQLAAGPSWHKFYLDTFLFANIVKSIRSFQPDILYAHLHEGAFWGHLARKATHRSFPLILDYQGSLTGEITAHRFIRSGSWVQRGFQRLEHWIEAQADVIVTSSTAGMRHLQKTGHTKPMFPLIDGVDTTVFQPASKDQHLFNQLQLPENKMIIVFLGLLTEYQGVDLLLQSIQYLRAKTDRFHFLIMGYPNVAHYRQKAKDLNIEDRITFTGRIDYRQANRYLNLGDIAISPKISSSEANGKLLNYMACGLPTVVFNSSTNRELLGESGIYANWIDSKDLAEQLITLAEQPGRRRQISNQLRARAVTQFSWQVQAQKLDNILKNL
ncbi:MAG: glycosyltransferase family 1 protein [Gemmatimonadetes bacterium]|nr:MAG: glycosyltransferase family 1 protein [Gemmatimonadota bacterium]